MPKTYSSPLSSSDMETLTGLAAKANRETWRQDVAPLYAALDGGDQDHPQAYLFLAWPAGHRIASEIAADLLAYLDALAALRLGASLVATVATDRDHDGRL